MDESTARFDGPVIPQERVFRRPDLALGLIRVDRHAPCQVHRHSFSELVIVVSGTGIHQAPGGSYPIRAGDVFVLHGEQAHGYVDTANLSLVNILFDLGALGIPTADLARLPGFHVLFTLDPRYRSRERYESRLHLDPGQLERIHGWVTAMETELAGTAAGGAMMAIGYFILIIGSLSRRHSRDEGTVDRPLHQLGRAIGYLEEHYAETVTLDDLARVSMMSRRSLTRSFHAAMGCSPIQYLLRLRIRRAVDLLRDGGLSIAAAGYRVGFSDSNYFARQFRAVMGESPRAFLAGCAPPGCRSTGR